MTRDSTEIDCNKDEALFGMGSVNMGRITAISAYSGGLLPLSPNGRGRNNWGNEGCYPGRPCLLGSRYRQRCAAPGAVYIWDNYQRGPSPSVAFRNRPGLSGRLLFLPSDVVHPPSLSWCSRTGLKFTVSSLRFLFLGGSGDVPVGAIDGRGQEDKASSREAAIMKGKQNTWIRVSFSAPNLYLECVTFPKTREDQGSLSAASEINFRRLIVLWTNFDLRTKVEVTLRPSNFTILRRCKPASVRNIYEPEFRWYFVSPGASGSSKYVMDAMRDSCRYREVGGPVRLERTMKGSTLGPLSFHDKSPSPLHPSETSLLSLFPKGKTRPGLQTDTIYRHLQRGQSLPLGAVRFSQRGPQLYWGDLHLQFASRRGDVCYPRCAELNRVNSITGPQAFPDQLEYP
ncbi:hypothetical protein AAG570_008339 [Ranatra chinensis]|uniref:Uncharacterized protein n=1 Tax=Ranatra chinensis TaxID=642074 RepID=A0ABD0XUA8_9HEMI